MRKIDVQEFSFNLEDNLFQLHQELKTKTYSHSDYTSFYIQDPKLRHIHKASVKDRVLHHAIFRILYPVFDKTFIFDSYSCRINKGTHRAVNRLQKLARKVSRNNTRNCFILKCDIRKFFDSIDHQILLSLLSQKIRDEDILWLLNQIIGSFYSEIGRGLPLGNITSQLFANIYLNQLDQFIKHQLRIKYYIRYCDDFVVMSENRGNLEKLISLINNFLQVKLNLSLHSDKILVRKYHQGIDFLGYIQFPYHRILRTKTKRRMFKRIKERFNKYQDDKISEESFNQTFQSYLGLLKHCHSYKLQKALLENLV